MRMHYQTLGVPMDASKDDIRRAFRALAKKFHPDHNPNDPAAEERFKQIVASYAIVMGRTQLPASPPADLSSLMMWAFWPLLWLPLLFSRSSNVETSRS